MDAISQELAKVLSSEKLPSENCLQSLVDPEEPTQVESSQPEQDGLSDIYEADPSFQAATPKLTGQILSLIGAESMQSIPLPDEASKDATLLVSSALTHPFSSHDFAKRIIKALS